MHYVLSCFVIKTEIQKYCPALPSLAISVWFSKCAQIDLIEASALNIELQRDLTVLPSLYMNYIRLASRLESYFSTEWEPSLMLVGTEHIVSDKTIRLQNQL